jgi:hypothetical protein
VHFSVLRPHQHPNPDKVGVFPKTIRNCTRDSHSSVSSAKGEHLRLVGINGSSDQSQVAEHRAPSRTGYSWIAGLPSGLLRRPHTHSLLGNVTAGAHTIIYVHVAYPHTLTHKRCPQTPVETLNLIINWLSRTFAPLIPIEYSNKARRNRHGLL